MAFQRRLLFILNSLPLSFAASLTLFLPLSQSILFQCCLTVLSLSLFFSLSLPKPSISLLIFSNHVFNQNHNLAFSQGKLLISLPLSSLLFSLFPLCLYLLLSLLLTLMVLNLLAFSRTTFYLFHIVTRFVYLSLFLLFLSLDFLPHSFYFFLLFFSLSPFSLETTDKINPDNISFAFKNGGGQVHFFFKSDPLLLT